MKVLVALCLLSSIIADSEPDADPDPALTYSLYGNLYGNVGYPSGYSAYQGYNNNGYPVYNGYSNYPNYQFMFPSNTPAPVTSYQPSLTNNFIPGYPLNQALNYHPLTATNIPQPLTATIQFPGVQGVPVTAPVGVGSNNNINNYPQQPPQLSPLGPSSSPQTDSSVQSIGKSFAPGINRFSPTPSYSGYPVLNNMPTANYNSNLNDGYGYNNQINSEQNNQGTPSKYGGTGYVTSSGGVYQVTKRSADSDPDALLYTSYPASAYTYSSYPSYTSGYMTPYYQPTYYHPTYVQPSLKYTYSLLSNYADAMNTGYNPTTGVVYSF